MFGEFLLANIAHTVGFPLFFQDVDNVAAAGFLVAVKITANGFGLLGCSIRNLFAQTEVQSTHGAGLNAERLLVFADAVTTHGALAGFARNVVFGDDFPGAGVNAVLATDADLLVDDDWAFFVFCDRFHRADRGAGGKIAVHSTVPRPERREPFEHRRLHGDPVRAG